MVAQVGAMVYRRRVLMVGSDWPIFNESPSQEVVKVSEANKEKSQHHQWTLCKASANDLNGGWLEIILITSFCPFKLPSPTNIRYFQISKIWSKSNKKKVANIKSTISTILNNINAYVFTWKLNVFGNSNFDS